MWLVAKICASGIFRCLTLNAWSAALSGSGGCRVIFDVVAIGAALLWFVINFLPWWIQ